MMELAEPESAMVDEGGSTGAWLGFAFPAEWYGKVDPWQGWTSVEPEWCGLRQRCQLHGI
jgi:hypothetical protein